jgi:hypothetical protein
VTGAGVKAAVEQSPLYYTPQQLAPLFGRGWTTRRVREWLRRAGVLEDRHGTLVTTAERLAAEFPEVYRRLLMRTS